MNINLEKIDKLDYTRYFSNIDTITGILKHLTRPYCKENCKISENVKCCGYDHHQHTVPDIILFIQKQEAISNGWIKHQDKYRCKYHNDSGCTLKRTISPVCLGYFCKDLKKHLNESSENKKLTKDFIKSMEVIRKCSPIDYNNNHINEYLEKSIILGSKVLKS